MGFFTLTEEQQMLKKAVHEFAEAEIAPFASEWDEKDECPIEYFQKLGELGITGIFVPEQYGGVGLGHVERMICLEEISRYSAGLGMAVMTHHLGIAPILEHGTESQKEKYLPDLCSGKKIAGLGVTEVTGGSDYMGQKTVAKKNADGEWKINGRKCFITNSHIADISIITARTGEDEKGRPKMSAFLLGRDTPGFAPGRKEHKLGLRGSVTGDLVMQDVMVTKDALIGIEGAGGQIGISAISEIGRAGMSAVGLGILRGCVEESTKFSKERVLYGKPLSKLQSVQFEIAQIWIKYESARLLSYYAAGLKDDRLPCTTEFSVAKLVATEGAVEAAKRLMDLMGGYGIINEYPAGRFLRDAIASIPSGGTSHIQQIVIASNAFSNFKI